MIIVWSIQINQVVERAHDGGVSTKLAWMENYSYLVSVGTVAAQTAPSPHILLNRSGAPEAQKLKRRFKVSMCTDVRAAVRICGLVAVCVSIFYLLFFVSLRVFYA